MGRNTSGVRVRVGQDGQRRSTYHQHDDRDGASGGGSYEHRGRGNYQHKNMVWRRGDAARKKQVSFKDRGGSGGIHKRLGPRGNSQGGGVNLRNVYVDHDGDEAMGAERSQAGRARPIGRGGYRGRGARRGRGGGAFIKSMIRQGGNTPPPGRSWHKVQVMNGNKYDKIELLTTIKNHCTVPFAPIYYSKMGHHTLFYVENSEMANALRSLNNVVDLSDGHKLQLSISPSAQPSMPTLTEDMVDKMKIVMSNRYKADTKALILTKFFADENFQGEPIFANLARGQIMTKVVDIIAQNISMLEAIELSDNKIYSLDNLGALVSKAPNVRILYLTNNMIRDVKELDRVRGWKLVELKVKGNPFASTFKDTAALQGAVRKIFPTLQVLDDAPLPQLITFDDDGDLDAGKPLPPSIQRMSVAVGDQEQVAMQFLQTYFNIYDQDSRQPLLEAYHDEAQMSMATAYPLNTQTTKSLQPYLSESRNLIRVPDSNRRQKFLRKGKLAIVSFINDLPKTQHDLNSFTLDVSFSSPLMMCMTMTGVFRERDNPAEDRNKPVRHFNRMFVIMRNDAVNGWNVVNETLFVTNPTPLQQKTAFTESSNAASVTTSQTAIPQPNAVSSVPDAATAALMVQQLAQKTNMNENYSKMCLNESGWNLEQAFVSFQNAQREGKIPIEAYEKI